MKKNGLEGSPINSLFIVRTSLIEIIISAIVIGFGISITVSSLTLLKNFNPFIGIIIGVLICSFSIGYLARKIILSRNKSYMIDGFFILNETINEIRDIPGYNFAEEIHSFFEAAFTENKALEHIWNSDPINLQDDHDYEPKSVNIIREAVEYYLLNKLSTHLLTYFNYPSKFNDNITVFQREKIPNVLLQNRFLELFSKSINDREHFIGVEESIKDNEDWYILDVDGAVFRKFMLVLPKMSEVNRNDNNQIEIKTKRFVLKMNVEFDRTNTVLPTGYREHYLGITGFEMHLANVDYDVKIQLSVELKHQSLFTRSGWEEYEWLDSFIDSFTKSFSKDHYFNDINWKTAYTIIRGLKEKSDIAKV